MIDRQARDQMASAIRSYLNEQIRAFEFSDALADIAWKTEDRTVRLIEDEFWHFYDDLKNHEVVATKLEWDYIYRFLLILESDAEIEVRKVRTRPPKRIVAQCALVVFVVLALWMGWGLQLLLLSIAFGLISLPLHFSRFLCATKPPRLELALVPFSSIGDLLRLRRQVPHFVKMPYPRHLEERKVRDPASEALLWLQVGVTCLIISPIVLLLEGFSASERRMIVKIPG